MKMNSTPMVEVIIPFHRIDEYLVAALDSIRLSENVDVRIVAINDTGVSVDRSQLKLTKTDVLIETSVRGYINALKVGVEASREKYVSFLDSDDLIHPEKLFRQVQMLRSKDLDFVSCGIQKINSRNQLSHSGSLLGVIPRTVNAKELWIIGSHGADSTILCNGDLLREHWVNHRKFESHFADFGWALSLPKHLRFGHIEENLYFYRSHSAQISKSPSLGDSWRTIYPLWESNLLNVFPEFPRKFIPSERESLSIAFPASMLNLKKTEIKNLIQFEKALLACLEGRSDREITEWKRTLARRFLIVSRGRSLRYWHAAPILIITVLKLKIFGFGFRKIDS